VSLLQLDDVAQTKGKRRRFGNAEGRSGAVTPCLEGDELGRYRFLLPDGVLRELAREQGALDIRRRKLPCEVFFWAVVLAFSAQQMVGLSTVATQVGVACALAGLGRTRWGVTKQAVSENMARRPWGFFARALQYLLASSAVGVMGPAMGLDLVRQMDVLLMDATLIPLAYRLVHTLPTGLQAHVRFNLLQGLPEVLDLTTATEDELHVDILRAPECRALYIFDLGYWCYTLFDEIIQRGQHFISRLKNRSNPLIKAVYQGEAGWVGKRLKDIQLTGEAIDLSVNLTCAKAQAQTRRKPRPRLTQRRQSQGHQTVRYMEHDVRLVGQWHSARQRWFLYVTSLTDRTAYPVELICDLYRLRWQIEVFFRNLKYVLGVGRFISQSENGLRIQVYAALIFYTLTRLVVQKAACEMERPLEDFSMPRCLRTVRDVLVQVNPLRLTHATPDDRERWEQALIGAVIAQGLRPNRHRPALLTNVRQCLPQSQAA